MPRNNVEHSKKKRGIVDIAVDRSMADHTLADVSFFRRVSAVTTAKMDQHCRWIHLEGGDVLVDAGEFSEEVFFLLRGELRYHLYTRVGKLLSIPAALPGSFVGSTALVKEMPHRYSIDAARSSTLACMNARIFQDFLQRDSDVLQALLSTMVQRQDALIDHIEELATLTVRARIQNELARLCRNSTNSDGSAVIFPVPTHEDLANRIGTQREAVSRELSHLQHTGVIFRRDGALFVPDIARLLDAQLKQMS